MAAIEVERLGRVFRTYKKQPGFWGAVRGLGRRRYESVWAVREASFTLEEGELVGFLGPNGAGKTTTLKMLAGLLHPSTGQARVLGHVPWERREAYRRQFALVLGQKNQMWWDLPARESLELNRTIYEIPRDRFRRTVEELTALLEVEDQLDVMVRELSLGERMKFELIAALLHQPRVLFLNEPTIGLDVVSQHKIRSFLGRHNREHGTTVLLTSHYMADIEELCRRVIIINHGAVTFDGLLSEVIDRFADDKLVTIHLGTDGGGGLAGLDGYGEVIEAGPARVRLRVRRDRVIEVCKALLDGLPVRDIDIEEIPIEEAIRRVFGA